MGRDKVHCHKPFTESNLGILKDSAYLLTKVLVAL